MSVFDHVYYHSNTITQTPPVNRLWTSDGWGVSHENWGGVITPLGVWINHWRHQWPKTETNGDNPWLASMVHADHWTRRRKRSHQTSDVISLLETSVVCIVLRNVWFLSFCLAYLSEGNMQWLGWHIDLYNCIVNTTKYKQCNKH